MKIEMISGEWRSGTLSGLDTRNECEIGIPHIADHCKVHE